MPEKIINNLTSSLPVIVKNIKDGWDNIQSLHIKTNSSASLPIWTCELGGATGGRWDGMVKPEDASVASDSAGGSDSDEESTKKSEERVPVVLASNGKGKKRPLNEDAEKPVTTDVKRKRSAEGGVKKKTKIVKGGLTKNAGESDGGSDADEASKGSEHVSAVLAGKGMKKPMKEDVQKPLTTKEVKQKRSAEGGVKKKVKIVNGDLTKSAKKALIGKKPGRP